MNMPSCKLRPLCHLVALGLIVGFFFLGCREESKVLLKVGEYEITQQMVNDRDALIRMDYPNETRSLGLRQLQEAYINAQILVQNGHPIDEATLEREKKRIDQATLMPERLQQVKNIFGEREKDYLYAYVLPVYANRVIYYEFFLNDEKIQASSLRQADEFLKNSLPQPQKWSALAKEKDLKSLKAKVSLSVGFEFVMPEKDSKAGEGLSAPMASPAGSNPPHLIQQKQASFQAERASEEGRRWVRDLLQNIKAGEVIPKVINQGEMGWMVCRYLKAPKSDVGDHHLDCVLIPKRDYAQWLSDERARISIQ